jgi:hypothetical protein
MEIRKEINGFYELADMVWSGAVDTLEDIQNANKENEFMDFLEMVFCDDVPTDTNVNDFIWFERDYIYENIGLTEDGELPEDETEEVLNESIESLELEDDFEEFCSDCDRCILDSICSTCRDCQDVFDNYKNGVYDVDDIKSMVKEETGLEIWM